MTGELKTSMANVTYPIGVPGIWNVHNHKESLIDNLSDDSKAMLNAKS